MRELLFDYFVPVSYAINVSAAVLGYVLHHPIPVELVLTAHHRLARLAHDTNPL